VVYAVPVSDAVGLRHLVSGLDSMAAPVWGQDPGRQKSGTGGGDAQRGGLLGEHHAAGTGEPSGLLQRRCSARRRHREAEVNADPPPRGELRGLRERIDDGAPGRNATARVAEAPEPRHGRRLGLRGAVACPQAHRRASTRGNGPRVEMKAGDRDRGACHRPTSGTRGCPHLSRCSDRTYEQRQTNEESMTHHAHLPRAAARLPIRIRSPFCRPWRSSNALCTPRERR